jgi:hypothetical protein
MISGEDPTNTISTGGKKLSLSGAIFGPTTSYDFGNEYKGLPSSTQLNNLI